MCLHADVGGRLIALSPLLVQFFSCCLLSLIKHNGFVYLLVLCVGFWVMESLIFHNTDRKSVPLPAPHWSIVSVLLIVCFQGHLWTNITVCVSSLIRVAASAAPPTVMRSLHPKLTASSLTTGTNEKTGNWGGILSSPCDIKVRLKSQFLIWSLKKQLRWILFCSATNRSHWSMSKRDATWEEMENI